jgi:hypothetical protein
LLFADWNAETTVIVSNLSPALNADHVKEIFSVCLRAFSFPFTHYCFLWFCTGGRAHRKVSVHISCAWSFYLPCSI